jgi:hypothetical protein
MVDVPDSPAARSLQRAVFELTPESAFLLFHTKAKSGELVSLRRDARNVSNALYQKLWLGGLPDGDINDETKESLATLASSEHWWARLFAAEVMVQHKEFRNKRTIDAMLADENELVRNSIRSIQEPDELRFAKVDK